MVRKYSIPKVISFTLLRNKNIVASYNTGKIWRKYRFSSNSAQGWFIRLKIDGYEQTQSYKLITRTLLSNHTYTHVSASEPHNKAKLPSQNRIQHTTTSRTINTPTQTPHIHSPISTLYTSLHRTHTEEAGRARKNTHRKNCLNLVIIGELVQRV